MWENGRKKYFEYILCQLFFINDGHVQRTIPSLPVASKITIFPFVYFNNSAI
jgi:hypothetical protein